MTIKRINEFPEGSGSLSNDDVFLFMDDPSLSAVTKKISLSSLTSKINANINLTPYALLYSPNFSGIPTVPTAATGTNTSQIANTSFVRSEINNLVDAAPAALDTLNELAASLNDDSNFASTVTNSLAGKANLNGAIFTGSISGPSGNFTDLTINNKIGVGTNNASGSLHIVNTGIALVVGDYNVAGAGGKVAVFIDDRDSQLQGVKTFVSRTGVGWNIGVNGTSYTLDNIGSGTNIGLYGFAGRGENNWGLWVHSGYGIFEDKVGIGTKNPLYNLDVVGTGNFNSLTVNGTGVSLSGHSHTSSNIIDFNSTVSGLLPVKNLVGSGYIVANSNSGNYTISVTGLQPSGNYAASVHNHLISDISGLQTALDSKQPSGVYASGIHYHISSDITNFSDSVSGLLPNISGVGYITSSFTNNTYTINATGLQPSGNYSVVGHSHLSSDITDFASSVSGLLPVKNIVAGNDISVTSVSGVYTINSTVTSASEANSLVTTVFNKTGSSIPKMSVVYINGGQGDQPTIQLAIATTEATSSKTYGITAEAIDNMSTGKVVVDGALTGLNTDQFNPTAPVGDVNGTVVYLSPSVSGAITTTKPYAPNHMVSVGTIVRTHQNDGIIEVKIQNGFELQELHNVAVNGASNGQFLQYNGSGLWIPSNSGNFTTLQVSGTNVSLNGHNHSSSDITDFNSSVSGLLPVKSIVGSGNINVSSVSGDFNISSSGLVKSDVTNIIGASGIVNIVTISQASYDSLVSKDINTLYFIT